MEGNFAVVTIFTLLFAVTTARISLQPPPSDLPIVRTTDDTHIDCNVEASNLAVASSNSKKSRSDSTENVNESDESENDRMIGVDSSPRSEYARFHAINRRFFHEPRVLHRSDAGDRRRRRSFERPLVMIPRSKISDGNDVVVRDEIGEDSLNRLKVKEDDGGDYHRRQRQRRRNHRSGGDDGGVATVVVKSREREVGFMKSIRKFLKHNFD